MVTNEELVAHYEKIRPQLEGDVSALKGFLISWCPAYAQDAQETGEGLMLEFSLDVSDRYIYSLIACLKSAYVENGSIFPPLSDSLYEEISNNLLRVRGEESEYTLWYFESLESEFKTRFPVTVRIMEQIGLDMVNRLRVTPDELNFGFYGGTEHAMCVLSEVMRR
ncbi:MAG: hypothetical protein EOO90_28295 [Pedobacter sp.]|nr:MAG: hypothetical protein EOO90_28295 [Pedobacter sp.]